MKTSHKIKGFLSALITFSFVKTAMATGLGPTDSIISQPVGVDVLPGGNSSASDIESSIIFSKILPFLISYAIGLSIALSVIAMIYGGYLFLTAYGRSESHDKAKKTVIYAALGLILSLTAYGIVKIVTNIQLS